MTILVKNDLECTEASNLNAYCYYSHKARSKNMQVLGFIHLLSSIRNDFPIQLVRR